MTFDYKNVLIFGTGKSGIAAVGLLQTTKANIILYEVARMKIKLKLS